MEITEKDFESQVLGSSVPVIVDFFAQWCGPCKMMAPVLESFERENEGRVRVCKVDIDKNESLAAQYNIMSIPTLIVFEGGEPVKQSVGYISGEQLAALV